MSRYIDADALTWLVEEYKLAISPITEEQERDNRLPLQMLTEFENMIDEQPTVDAVTVVRCRECRWRHDDSSTMWLPCMEIKTSDDWFCAGGERRTDEQQT